MNETARVGLARRLWRASADYIGLLLFLAVLFVGFGLASRRFLSLGVLRTIANQVPHSVVLAVAMTYVLIIAGIDLSVGSILAFAGIILGHALHYGIPLPLALIICLTAGAVCGLVNGLLITRGGLPPFIATLGMMSIARGFAFLWTRGRGVDLIGDEPRLFEFLGSSKLIHPAYPGNHPR